MIQDVKKIYLCTPDLKIRTVLNGLQTDSVEFIQYIKDFDELNFTVDRFISVDGVQIESNGYEDLKVYMYLYLEDIGFFQMQEPTIVNDGNQETKEIKAYSIDKEFEQKSWIGLKINNGEDDSLEMLADGNKNPLGFALNFITLYKPDNPQLSFMDLMLEKMPYWSIGYIDPELNDKVIPIIEVDNANIYSIMTTTVAPRLDMIFMFDYMNRRVNAYHKDHLDFDTNIFIGFRNLANEVKINVDEDSVSTRFRVRGDNDLKFLNVNFGDEQCFNLDYFLGEPYMTEALAQKVKYWINLRDSYREEYINVEKEAATFNARIDGWMYTVPSDETYWKQWDNMSEEALYENLNLFEAELVLLQTSIDERPEDEQYDADHRYIPKTDSSGAVDHNYYLQLLWSSTSGTRGFYRYKEITLYIIPYILQAILNINVPDNEKIRYGTESEEDWQLYGYEELEAKRVNYEEDKLPALNKFSKDWKDMTDEEKVDYVNEEGYNIQGRNDYLHIKAMLGNVDTPGTIYYYLNILKTNIDQAQAELDLREARIQRLNNAMAIETVVDSQGEPLFTPAEVNYIKTLFIDTDYTNSNILATSVDTVITMIDREKELYDDAMSKLSEVSQPQYDFEASLDNLIRIPEFKEWVSDLSLMKFIRLGIRDDYSVKLRVVEITYNPCEVTDDLDLVFSSMIKSKSGRNDLTQIIDGENFRAAKNSISIGTGNAKNATQYAEYLLSIMTNNGLFTKAVTRIASGVAGEVDKVGVTNIVSNYMQTTTYPANRITGTAQDYSSLFGNISPQTLTQVLTNTTDTSFGDVISQYLTEEQVTDILLNADQGNFNQVISKYLDAETVTSILLNAQAGNFDQVITKYLTADSVSTVLLNAETGNFDQVVTKYLSSDAITAKLLDAQEGNFDKVVAKYLTSDTVISKMISADQADFGTVSSMILNAGTINAKNIVGESGDFDTLATNVLTAGQATIEQIASNKISAADIDVGQITGDYAEFAELISPYIEAGQITADAIIAGLVQATTAQVELLTAQTAFMEYLSANLIVASEIQVNDLKAKLAQIDTLQADTAFVRYLQSLSSSAATSVVDDAYIYNAVAGKITVGDLAAGNIVLTDNMQILSENGALTMNGTALQIHGTDSEGNDYVGVQLGYDTQHNPSLIIRNGDGSVVLTPSGITANAIADGLIVNNMVGQGSLNLDRLSEPVITANQYGGINIEQVYTGNGSFGVEYTQFKQDTSSALDDLGQQIQENAHYDLYIETPNGKNLRGGNITLNARLFKNSVEVTNEWDGEYFFWTRHSKDSSGDIYWNSQHATGRKSLVLSSNDVILEADFECEFVVNGNTVAVSG